MAPNCAPNLIFSRFSRFGPVCRLAFEIFKNYMPEAINATNLVALSVTSQELGKGLFCSPTKVGHMRLPNHYEQRICPKGANMNVTKLKMSTVFEK